MGRAAAPGRMKWSKGNWACPSCTGYNFSKNSGCIRCGAPMPAAETGPGDQHPSACTAVFAVDAQRPHVARPDTGQCNTQHGPCGAYTPAARRRSCHADDGLGSPMRAHQQAAWPGSVRYAPVAAPTCVLFPRCEHSLCARTRFVFLCIHSKRVSLPRTYAFRSCARTLFQSVYAPERVSY